MAVRVEQIVDFLADRVVDWRLGADASLDGQSALVPGAAGTMSFASRRDDATAAAVRDSASSLLLVLPEYLDRTPTAASAIAVAEPRLEFARVVTRFFVTRPNPGIHARAVIHPDATLGQGAWIDAGAVVGAGCRIGDRVCIGANAVLGEGIVVGDDAVVGPGTVIGHVGFGYAREPDGTPVLLPHTGSVRIGDRVEIGANTAIDRGTIDDTVIEDDAKIDNLVHIAHNCRVRRGAFVIATSILCGGVDVGEGAWIAPNAAVREQLSVGDGAVVGLSATVVKDVEPGAVVAGSPARHIRP